MIKSLQFDIISGIFVILQKLSIFPTEAIFTGYTERLAEMNGKSFRLALSWPFEIDFQKQVVKWCVRRLSQYIFPSI